MSRNQMAKLQPNDTLGESSKNMRRSLNGSKQSELDTLANQLPQRAAAVLAAKPPGARTKY